MQDLVITTSNLTKQFGSRIAVNALDLAIHAGSIFGFLGPNGAGKTTTIRMLLGLVYPTRGSGTILGYDMLRERAAFLPQIGALVESPAFYPYLSGYDNLRIMERTSGLRNPRRLAEVLELVNLQSRAKDRYKTYSLGMKQRLAIAATLLNNPRIIFLDEPTNGLDPAGVVEIRELILKLSTLGHTIFLSSHLLYEVEQLCTEVAIINHGALVVQGNVEQMLKKGDRVLIEALPLANVQEAAARFGVQFAQEGEHTLSVELPREQIPAFVSTLSNAGVQIYQVTPQKRSLEQFFLESTGEPRLSSVLPADMVISTPGVPQQEAISSASASVAGEEH